MVEHNIWNPLYDHFERTGCFLCHLQRKDTFKIVYERYPEQWAEIKSMENKLFSIGAANTEIFRGYTTYLLEKEWAEEDRLNYGKPEQMKLFMDVV